MSDNPLITILTFNPCLCSRIRLNAWDCVAVLCLANISVFDIVGNVVTGNPSYTQAHVQFQKHQLIFTNDLSVARNRLIRFSFTFFSSIYPWSPSPCFSSILVLCFTFLPLFFLEDLVNLSELLLLSFLSSVSSLLFIFSSTFTYPISLTVVASALLLPTFYSFPFGKINIVNYFDLL